MLKATKPNLDMSENQSTPFDFCDSDFIDNTHTIELLCQILPLTMIGSKLLVNQRFSFDV